MSVRRILACLAVPTALAVALGLLWTVRAPHLSASLYDLVGARVDRIPAFVREASSSDVAMVVSSADAEKARATARRLAERFPVADGLPTGALEFIRANRGGLVVPETAALLQTPEGRTKVAKRALRRLYGSPLPPVLGFEDDPFGLTDAYLMSLAPSVSARTPEGWPVLRTNGVTRILLRHRLSASDAFNLDRMIAFCSAVEAVVAVDAPEVRVRLAGAPVHAAASAQRSKREIGFLTWFSLAFIAALSILVFRSVRWIPLLAGSLAVAALAGGLVLVAAFHEIHVMTFVMGTTVLGLVIDYSFHWLLSPSAAKPTVRRGLLVSFLTTEISLVPLMLASIPVLRQSALFLGAGLAAAFGYVLSCYPATGSVCPKASAPVPRGRFALPLMIVLSLAVMAGLVRTEVRTEMTSLYRPSADLLEAERQRAAFGAFDFSKLPSLSVRREQAENVRRLYAEQGAALAQALQVAALTPPPAPQDVLLRPQALMNAIFKAWTDETVKRLAWAVLALVVVLTALCRLRAVRLLLPALLAIAVVAGGLGWAGVPVNLFHLLAAFLLLGMGVDYAVFLQTGGAAAVRPALCSLLTSVAGFGALAFVSFPVVASFGLVLGLGLPVSFAVAYLLRPSGCASAGKAEGIVQVEVGASPWGMEALWILYRIFGLRVLHALAAAVGICVWTFSPSARRASPSWRKVVNFTRSLADKLVVMAEGRNLPQVATDGSEDAAAFLEDVKSGKGVFVLSSHVGTIEVLTALGDCTRSFHAWMDFDRTGVFNRFYLNHAKRRKVVVHPISEFGMQTVFEGGDLLDSGDCLVMAGDRGDGAFRFAAAFDHPVYFVACVADGGCRYRAVIRRLSADRHEMQRAYRAHLASLVAAYPDQHFAWEGDSQDSRM